MVRRMVDTSFLKSNTPQIEHVSSCCALPKNIQSALPSEPHKAHKHFDTNRFADRRVAHKHDVTFYWPILAKSSSFKTPARQRQVREALAHPATQAKQPCNTPNDASNDGHSMDTRWTQRWTLDGHCRNARNLHLLRHLLDS